MRKRNATEIRVWMIRNGIREADIVRTTGVEQTYVNKTLHGHRNNRKVLRYLLDQGCPAKYLGLPTDMLDAA